jgi:hypothetical protein
MEQIEKYITIEFLIVFMSLSYIFKKMVWVALTMIGRYIIAKYNDLFNTTFVFNETSEHIPVLVIGFIIGLPFYFHFEVDLMRLLITYTVGTSLHDLIIKFLINKAKKVLQENK